MNELVSMLYGFARTAWRRRWVAVITAWAIVLPAWALVLMIPDRYEASARVFVDARTPLRQGLEGIAIQEDYDSQLALVREALLSRPQLEAVARQTDLDAHVTTPDAMDALIGALQKQVSVNSFAATNAAGQSRGDAIYMISYQHPDRDKSVAVVRTLLDNLQEGTDSGNRTGASQAQEFLNREITVLERRLQDAEQRLAEFKKNNLGLIPGEDGDYFARQRQQMAGLQQAETALAVAYSRRSELQRQLNNARAYLPGASAAGGGGGGGGVALDVTQRRQVAERRLEELLLKYTDSYYEVVETRRTIEELKTREAEELAELQRGGAGTGAIRSLAANPVYQQIQEQLNQVQVEVASHQGAIEQHKRELANLSRFVDQAPEVEQEFAGLNREYDVTKTQYEQLVARREQARVTDNAARAGIVSFDVIEPPRAPITPSSPNRKLLFIACLLLGLGAGVALAALPQLLKPTFTDIGSIERKFGVAVLGAVSAAIPADQVLREKKDTRSVVFACVALVALTGVMVVIGGRLAQFVHGLSA